MVALVAPSDRKKKFKEELKELVENVHYDPPCYEQDRLVKLCYIEQLRHISCKVCTSSTLNLLGLRRPILTFKNVDQNTMSL